MAFVLKRCVYDPAVITDDLVDIHYELRLFTPKPGNLSSRYFASCATIFGGRPDVLDPIIKNLDNINDSCSDHLGQSRTAFFLLGMHVLQRKNCRTACLHIFEQCGHMPNFERPEEFNCLVLNFLSGHPLQFVKIDG